MKILITGATGFVGGHLCEKLHSEGHHIYCLVRNQKKFELSNIPGKMILGGLKSDRENTWIKDLPKDLDIIIHTAGIVHSFDTNEFYSINTKSTQQLLNDLSGKFQTLQFIFISSLAASGPNNLPLPTMESSPCNPISEYGKSKLMAENILKENLPSTWSLKIIRPPMVIGPRDTAILDVFKMVKSGFTILVGRNAPIKTYSFVCVFDLVDLIIKSIHYQDKNKQIYFASYPELITQQELINSINQKFQKKIFQVNIPLVIIRLIGFLLSIIYKLLPLEVRLTPDKIKELAPSSWTCSSLKSEQELKMTYKWDLEQTIDATFKDYKERDWI